jgi:hypothetical protein
MPKGGGGGGGGGLEIGGEGTSNDICPSGKTDTDTTKLRFINKECHKAWETRKFLLIVFVLETWNAQPHIPNRSAKI